MRRQNQSLQYLEQVSLIFILAISLLLPTELKSIINFLDLQEVISNSYREELLNRSD